MRTIISRCSSREQKNQGFTLTEVIISLAIAGVTLGGVLYGYVVTTDQSEWSSCSLAAESVAMQGVEQARAAKWDPQAWPVVDELGITNYSQVVMLDTPATGGHPLMATNYVSITWAYLNNPTASSMAIAALNPGTVVGIQPKCAGKLPTSKPPVLSPPIVPPPYVPPPTTVTPPSSPTVYPPLRQIRSDCVWMLPYRKGQAQGPFTNSVVTLRASDQ